MSLLIEIVLNNYRKVTDCYFGIESDDDIASAIEHMFAKFAGCFTRDDVTSITTTLCPVDEE